MVSVRLGHRPDRYAGGISTAAVCMQLCERGPFGAYTRYYTTYQYKGRRRRRILRKVEVLKVDDPLRAKDTSPENVRKLE